MEKKKKLEVKLAHGKAKAFRECKIIYIERTYLLVYDVTFFSLMLILIRILWFDAFGGNQRKARVIFFILIEPGLSIVDR